MEWLYLLTCFLLCWRLIVSVERIKIEQIQQQTAMKELELESNLKFLECHQEQQ